MARFWRDRWAPCPNDCGGLTYAGREGSPQQEVTRCAACAARAFTAALLAARETR
jgi:hypothetical protein